MARGNGPLKAHLQKIPEAALASHIALLGKTGSGKSYAVQGEAERLIEDKHRVCIIDPMDRFWGLRLLANGASSGLDVVIFGGQRGDLPLTATHGAAIAEIVGTTSTPVILVTRQMTVADRTRFFTDFAMQLVRRNTGPLHLVIDEAHLFMPQQGARVAGGVPAMLHAGNNLVALGRGIGLRIILLSQRPAKLHKDSLTQVETLVAFRLIAPQDRNAIREWIREWADEHTGAALMASLPSLPTGTAWLWAPELEILREIKFPRIHTFDSGKALAPGTPAPVLRPLDIGAVSRQLAQVAEEAAANDPRRLKLRIADLERQVAANEGAKINTTDIGELAIAEERGAARGRREVIERVVAMATENWLPAMQEAMTKGIEQEIAAAQDRFAALLPLVEPAPAVHRGTPVYTAPAPKSASVGLFKPALPHGLRTCLIAVAQHRGGIDRDQLTVLTGYKRSTRDAYIRKLLGRGDVAVAGDGRVIATQAGVAELGDDYQPLPTGAGLRDHWLSRLPDGERRVLEVLLQAYPNDLQRADIDVTTGYKRSTRDAYLRRLITRRLVEFGGSGMRASARLFDA
jgi:hypothetical protein